jgi:YedE family putative selenium metabolism protein
MRNKITTFFASRPGIVFAGATIGGLAALLVYAGNPPNMGICIAGFLRDIGGALGFHREGAVQYIRPEIMGIVLGAFITARLFSEHRNRATTLSLIPLILGTFAAIGALVFQGCPLRTLLRLAGGDLNALVGIAGFGLGVIIGVQLLKAGYTPGRTRQLPAYFSWLVPITMVGMLLLLIFRPRFAEDGPIFSSYVGTGSMHAAIWFSLGVGLLIGFLGQRTRFCIMGSLRDVALMRNTHLLSGALSLLVAATVTNIFLGQIHVGFSNQPVVQNQHLWNFLGMVLVGIASALAGGCPTRQLILTGEGNGDAAYFILGMFGGGVIAHNFGLVSPCVSGPMEVTIGPSGMIAVVAGIVVCVWIGLHTRVGRDDSR